MVTTGQKDHFATEISESISEVSVKIVGYLISKENITGIVGISLWVWNIIYLDDLKATIIYLLI